MKLSVLNLQLLVALTFIAISACKARQSELRTEKNQETIGGNRSYVMGVAFEIQPNEKAIFENLTYGSSLYENGKPQKSIDNELLVPTEIKDKVLVAKFLLVTFIVDENTPDAVVEKIAAIDSSPREAFNTYVTSNDIGGRYFYVADLTSQYVLPFNVDKNILTKMGLQRHLGTFAVEKNPTELSVYPRTFIQTGFTLNRFPNSNQRDNVVWALNGVKRLTGKPENTAPLMKLSRNSGAEIKANFISILSGAAIQPPFSDVAGKDQ